MARTRLAGMVIFPLLALLLFGNSAYRRGDLAPLKAWLLFSAIYVVLFLVITRLRTSRVIRQLLREGENKAVVCEHVLEITPDALVESTDISEFRSKWVGIERVEETADHTFIYVQATAAHMIPRAAILEGNYEAFRDEIRRILVARES